MDESKIRNRWVAPLLKVLIVVALVCLIIFWIVALASQNHTSSFAVTNTPSETTNLNATVETGYSGIYITNDETDTWTNCMVGLNGSNGIGFDNPPYKTSYGLTFSPNATTTIPYGQIIASDGTRFDYTTHAVTSVVIICDPTGGVDERYSIYGGQ